MKTLLKTAAIELGVSKAKIKEMIRGKHIGYELIDGHYYVDTEEVKAKLNAKPLSTQFLPLDDVMKFILKETLEDFKYTNIGNNHKLLKTIKKILKNGCISDFDELEYLIAYFSNSLFNGYINYPTEFVKWFNIQTSSDFYLIRNLYFHKNRDLSLYLEHFVMFDKLTNGKIKIHCNETFKLKEIKDYHFKQST